MYVLKSSITFDCIYLSKKKRARYDKNVYGSSCKVPILMELEFCRLFGKYSNTKCHKNPSIGSPVILGQTRRSWYFAILFMRLIIPVCTSQWTYRIRYETSQLMLYRDIFGNYWGNFINRQWEEMQVFVNVTTGGDWRYRLEMKRLTSMLKVLRIFGKQFHCRLLFTKHYLYRLYAHKLMAIL
jgi:hypothetical protein